MQILIDYINELNIISVLAAAVAAFICGAIWYSKPVFAKQWAKEIGIVMDNSKSTDGMGRIMGLSFMSTLVTSAAMGILVEALVLTELHQGALLGLLVTLGLLGTNKLMMSQFEQRSIKYWLITLGGDIFSLSVMGGVLVALQ